MKLRVSLLACAVVALLCGCDDATPTTPAQAADLPTQLEDAADFSGNNAYVHCAALCDMGPRPTGSPAYARQVHYLAQALSKAGWQVQQHEFTPLPGRQMVNLCATYGEAAHTRPLMIACHIDTKGQGDDAILGADDGASGAAVLLELARMLARRPELAGQVELVCFDGEEAFGARMSEEDGLYGSRYEVETRETLPTYMINLDMVGGFGKVIGVPALDTDPGMYTHYTRAVRKLGLSEDRWTVLPISYWDDHRPFMENGVATLNLIADFRGARWWHTKRDDMSRISPASLGETGRLVWQLIHQILAAESAE